MLYDRLDWSVLWAERRLGRATWPLIGLLSLGLAALYLLPAPQIKVSEPDGAAFSKSVGKTAA